MYTVIGRANSRATRVLWMLEELGQAYEHIPAAPRSEGVVSDLPPRIRAIQKEILFL